MRSDCVKIQNPNSRRGAYGWAENLWIQDPESRAWVGGQCMGEQGSRSQIQDPEGCLALRESRGGCQNHRSKSNPVLERERERERILERK